MKNEEIKKIVMQKYGEIASQQKQEKSSCGCCCGGIDKSVFGIEYSVFNEDYSQLEGYNPDADLSLGCGLPTEHARISSGDTVIDLGSGAGNDCFIARSIVGEQGRVIGLDFTSDMIGKAKENVQKLGYTNIDFVLGDIEEMPIDSEVADVVVSNCVLNLVPDKKKAFAEIFRVLKKGGHFCVSDIVLEGQLPDDIKNDLSMYAGCVSGAVQRHEYLKIIQDAGFENIQIKKDRPVDIPDEILEKYITRKSIAELREKKAGIFSITVYAEKSKCVQNNYNFNHEPE